MSSVQKPHLNRADMEHFHYHRGLYWTHYLRCIWRHPVYKREQRFHWRGSTQETDRERGGRRVRAGHCSHVDDVLDVEVLQGSQVRVHTPLVLEDNLLKDAVQELPLLEVATVSLVCEDNRHHKFSEPLNPLGPCPRVTARAPAGATCPLPPLASAQRDAGGNDAADAAANDGDSPVRSLLGDRN